MKGIILAGGRGTRLWPLTKSVSKQLLPVFDKPLIYYPLTTLMLTGVTEFLVITTPEDGTPFKRLLGDGSEWGVSISYAEQPSPDGLAQALIIAEDFIAGEQCTMILGDNIFYGSQMSERLQAAPKNDKGATVFAYYVGDPKRFGIVEFDDAGVPICIEEKPEHPKSQWALTGLYIFDSRAAEYARRVKPSARGELEITDVLQQYLDERDLAVERLGRGYMWVDCGTHDSLMSASELVASIERSQSLKVGCPEEVAFRLGLIDADQLRRLAGMYSKNSYGDYLLRVANQSNME